MRTTVNLDDDLWRQAKAIGNVKTKTELIEKGLRALVEQESRRRLVALRGKMPDARAPQRRRLPA